MKHGYANFPVNARLVTGTLILCLALLFSRKSIASTTTDSLKAGPVQTLNPRPIRLTEAAARQVLKDKADLIMLQGVVSSQETLLKQKDQAISSQSQTIQQLNERQQQEKNRGTTAQSQAEAYRQKWRGAKWEVWGWRIGVVVYVVARLKLL